MHSWYSGILLRIIDRSRSEIRKKEKKKDKYGEKNSHEEKNIPILGEQNVEKYREKTKKNGASSPTLPIKRTIVGRRNIIRFNVKVSQYRGRCGDTLKNRWKAIWRHRVDASGRFEAINSCRMARARLRRGGRPIGRRARLARSCISTLANHSFWLIVEKSAAIRVPSQCKMLSTMKFHMGTFYTAARVCTCERARSETRFDRVCPWIFIVFCEIKFYSNECTISPG